MKMDYDEVDEDELQAPVKARTPWVIVLLLTTALLVKLVLFVMPYFPPEAAPPTLYHRPGSGFAVEEGPGGYSYLSVQPSYRATSLHATSTSLSSLTASTSRADVSTSSSSPSATASAPSRLQDGYFRTKHVAPPEFVVDRTGETSPGLLFLGPRGNGTRSQAPMIVTEDGELVWVGPEGISTNTKLQLYNGKPHITFWKGASAATFGHGYGAVHILDETYTEVARICPQDLDIAMDLPDDSSECLLDMHDSFLTQDGTLVVTAYNVTMTDLSQIGGPADAWVFDSMFYEIDIGSGEILFSWRVLDHLDQIPLKLTKYPLSINGEALGTSSQTPFDFFHINAVQPLDDGYLVNSRHTFSIFKLDKTGSVKWRFSGDDGGDFKLDPNIAFSWQHHARAFNFTASTLRLSIFNNDNSEAKAHNATAAPSRALEIFLDLERMEALLLQELDDLKDARYAEAMGSVQHLEDGHVLVGYGKDPLIKEYDDAQQVIYSADFGGNVSGPDVVASYRVYKYDNWTATPATSPKVVAEHAPDTNETWLYASWNGATPNVYDTWYVRGGYIEDALEDVGLFPRSGFETQIRLPEVQRFYMVIAVSGSTARKSSNIVEVPHSDLGYGYQPQPDQGWDSVEPPYHMQLD